MRKNKFIRLSIHMLQYLLGGPGGSMS